MPALTPEALRQRVRARLQEQRTLVERLLRRRELLAGSLFMRWGVCGKKGCVCQTGQRHGPYYVLSRRSGGRGGFTYLDEARAAEARALVRARQDYKADLKHLRKVNEQLVTLLRRYQEATGRRGDRRLGVPAASRG
jgi:hypothetical protein